MDRDPIRLESATGSDVLSCEAVSGPVADFIAASRFRLRTDRRVRVVDERLAVATRTRIGMARGRERDERGASLVEFTLVLPLLLILIFGAFSGAVAYNNQQDIVYAAREGARYGASIPQSQCSPTSNCLGKTWAQLVQSVVVSRASGEISASEVCVALVSGDPGAPVGSGFTTKSDGTSCYSDGNNDKGSRVQVSISHSASINIVFYAIPVTEATKATIHFES